MPKTLPDSFFTRLDALIEGEVHTDGASLAACASDASNHRVVPRGVITPRTVDDLSAVVRSSAEEGVPITSRGAGTNVAGNAIGAGVVIDYSRHLNRVLSVDPKARIATVQPGAVLDHVRKATHTNAPVRCAHPNDSGTGESSGSRKMCGASGRHNAIVSLC